MKLLLLIVSASLLAACATRDTTEKPVELEKFSAEAKVNRLWSVDTGGAIAYRGIKLEPYFDGDSVYTAAYNGKISHFETQSGKRFWQKNTQDLISAGINGNSDKLFYGTRNGDLVAVNKEDAREIWRAPLKSEILVKPITRLGLVVVRTLDGNIQAFASNSGEKRWSYKMTVPDLSLHGNGQPIIIDNQVLLVGSDNGRMVALDVNNGRILFETPITISDGTNAIERLVDIDMRPDFDGNLLYISAYQNGFYAINLQRGKAVWRHEASTFQAIAYDDDKIYFTDINSKIWALNRSNGQVVWVQEGLRARKVSAPIVHQNQIVVTDFKGFLHVLSSSDGRFVARESTGKAGHISKPLFVSGQADALYYTGQNGQLTAYQIASNKVSQ